MSGEFAGLLRERILIEQVSTSRDAMGLQEDVWEEVARCLAAVQPEGFGPESEGQALSAMQRFRVTIRVRPGIAVGQRIRWKERVLAVRQITIDPRQSDRLVMRCEEVRLP